MAKLTNVAITVMVFFDELEIPDIYISDGDFNNLLSSPTVRNLFRQDILENIAMDIDVEYEISEWEVDDESEV